MQTTSHSIVTGVTHPQIIPKAPPAQWKVRHQWISATYLTSFFACRPTPPHRYSIHLTLYPTKMTIDAYVDPTNRPHKGMSHPKPPLHNHFLWLTGNSIQFRGTANHDHKTVVTLPILHSSTQEDYLRYLTIQIRVCFNYLSTGQSRCGARARKCWGMLKGLSHKCHPTHSQQQLEEEYRYVLWVCVVFSITLCNSQSSEDQHFQHDL